MFMWVKKICETQNDNVINSDFLLKQQCGNSASQVAVVERCHLPARCKDLILVSIPPCPTLVPQVSNTSATSATSVQH